MADLDAAMIGAFLDHLETGRGNSAATRNARLAAIHSLFAYAALRHPEHAAADHPGARHPAEAVRQGNRVLPHDPEIAALLAAPDRSTLDRPARPRPAARRIQTGLRISELIAPGRRGITLGAGAHVRCRRQRAEKTAPSHSTEPVKQVAAGLARTNEAATPTSRSSPTRTGRRLSHDAVQRRESTYTRQRAAIQCPSLRGRKRQPAHFQAH